MNDELRYCPHCGGEIQSGAVLCRHCRRDLAPGAPPSIRGPWVRDPTDRKIAGVSAMVGRNLGLSAMVTRLLFLGLVFFGNGLGLFLYLFAWIATPLGFSAKAPVVRWTEWLEDAFRGKKPAAREGGPIVPRNPEEPDEHRA